MNKGKLINKSGPEINGDEINGIKRVRLSLSSKTDRPLVENDFPNLVHGGGIHFDILVALTDVLKMMRKGKVNSSVFQALLHLYFSFNCEVILSDMAKELGVSTANFTGIADSMESLGLASRLRCETDRRLVRMKLTRDGCNVVEWVLKRLSSIQTSDPW